MFKKIILTAGLISMSLLSIEDAAQAKTSESKKNKVVLISFDGMRNDLTKQYLNEGKLPNIKRLTEKGVMAEKTSTVTPSLTAPSHAAIATGSRPAKTGIVSNQWHESNKILTNKDDAFQTKLAVPPVWVEARKQGKTTATIAFPGANPKDGKQGDYSIFYGETWSPASQKSLKFNQASDWNNVPKSFSPLKESDLSIKVEKGKNHMIHILALDSTNDHKQNYESYIISEDKQVDAGDSFTKGKKWGSLVLKVTDSKTAGFWFKIRSNNTDLTDSIPMYRTAVTSGLIEGPKGFAHEIKSRFGFFPAQDDNASLEKGWITRKEYQEISSRFVMWITDVSLYIKHKHNPDLVMFYGPQIDHEQHKYLLTDPRQPGYSKEKSKAYSKYIEWSYRLADKVAGKTMNSLKENDHLLIVSDHGMEPAHSTLEPNKLLKDAGLLKVDKNNQIDYKKSKAYAVPSSSIAHVYINLLSREKGGVVSKKEYNQVRSNVVQAFKEAKVKRHKKGAVLSYELKELYSGTRIEGFSFNLVKEHSKNMWESTFGGNVHPYEKIIKVTPKNKNFGHANSGDVVLIGAPGYIMGSSADKSIKPAIELGTHGGDPSREKLRPVFLAAGQEFPAQKNINSMTNLKVAPTIYELLELKKPSFVEKKGLTN
ncbi:putative AlkP superfamily phosphohydrolase/phosphomutase [Peribacillus deserti]|uniref:AlkP superfamily phosphohydrolase/phosphomutase n=1 Tax=Peribacillus deserti TaxID=673318 RepID=A0ABS2QLZ3_9BACI|nr:alkaline phosphatase family protein [Peribacillus deserti]MBM7694188.1 putative AlkP superfamily phosphohydrolase/phosphomutase [Peribacillus deserti]